MFLGKYTKPKFNFNLLIGNDLFYTVLYYFRNENPDTSILGSLDKDAYKEYYQAAQNGHHMNDCSTLYKNCTSSSKEYIKLINL